MSFYYHWQTEFEKLDMCDGTLTTIMDDEEDMLTIKWSDGMWIDVGYIKNDKKYYITTVLGNTLEAWNNPLSVVEVIDRDDLFNAIQNEIFRCRRKL